MGQIKDKSFVYSSKEPLVTYLCYTIGYCIFTCLHEHLSLTRNFGNNRSVLLIFYIVKLQKSIRSGARKFLYYMRIFISKTFVVITKVTLGERNKVNY